MSHYFTIAQANAILPEINVLMGDLLERRAKVVRQAESPEMQQVLSQNDVGNATASEIALEFVEIERLIEELQAYGCSVKDLNGGLVDFLARRNGRDVYLCWRYGEAVEIKYYHELHTGFNGRQLLNPADFD